MTARISARAVETFPNLVYDPSCLCLGRAEYVVAQVDGQCARGTRHVRQRAGVAAERADAAHEVAVLERGGTLRHDVVAVKARSNASTDDSSVCRAYKRNGQGSQRREASENATQRRSSRGKRCGALVPVVVSTGREVRAGASKHYCTHRSGTSAQPLSSNR